MSLRLMKPLKGLKGEYGFKTVFNEESRNQSVSFLIEDSKRFDIPVGVYVEIKDNINGFERGLQCIQDNEMWSSDICDEVSFNDSLMTLQKVCKNKYELPPHEKKLGISRDEFLTEITNVCLKRILSENEGFKELLKMSKEGGMEFGYSFKIRIEPNDNPIDDMLVYPFQDVKFHEDIPEWVLWVTSNSIVYDKIVVN